MKYDYCLYSRKSTESDEKQALSIDSQIKEMLAIAERDELNVIEIKRESHSAKDSGERPVFNELIRELKADRFQGILTWQTDRLSRNAGDLGIMVDLIDQKHLCEIRTYNQVFTNSPNDKFLLMILGSQAKLENDNKAINVKRGMKTKCEMGIRPCPTPLGYLNDPIHAKGLKVITLDPERATIIKEIFQKSANGVSGRSILDWLESIGFKSRTGKNLALSTLYDMLSNPYYYGEFEWPRKSGNWYRVNHESIITKDVFDKIQERFKTMPKGRYGSKEFNYTNTLKCGECGSGIIAQEKFKNLANGTRKRYVYYTCSRYTNRHCSQQPINEDEITKQLLKLIDKIDLDKFNLRKEYEYEVKRYHKYSEELDNEQEKIIKKQISIRSHMKYVLNNGTIEEKKRLLNNLGSQLILIDRKIKLNNSSK
ncbi:MAG: recombinase family protein [Patescibacteria group bacterium]|nr:recombinase family protein [Patescibacteria group bacterium]